MVLFRYLPLRKCRPLKQLISSPPYFYKKLTEDSDEFLIPTPTNIIHFQINDIFVALFFAEYAYSIANMWHK
jgi:hypothetical protein